MPARNPQGTAPGVDEELRRGGVAGELLTVPTERVGTLGANESLRQALALLTRIDTGSSAASASAKTGRVRLL